MNTQNSQAALIIGLVIGLFVGSAVMAQEEGKNPGELPLVLIKAGELQWRDGPLPGTQLAVMEGNPKNPGPFTMRLKLPAHYKIPPHSHPADERATVISGTFNVGRGETFDPKIGKSLPAGGFMLMPPNLKHFAWVKEETIIQINGVGPWALNFVDPADDPRKK